MNLILIGSRALNLRAPNLLKRSALDFDFIGSKEDCHNWIDLNKDKINPTEIIESENKIILKGDSICEFDIIQPGSSNELLLDLVKSDSETIKTTFGLIPNLDLLFTIKSSHKYKKFTNDSSIFWKTLIDYHMMKEAGAKIRPEYEAFHKLREKASYAAQKHPKLNQSKDAFFSDINLIYKYDHDSIHEAVAIGDRPAYTYYLKDGAQVECDKEKFFAVDEQIRINGVIEESICLALERGMLNAPEKWTPEKAWHFAFAKVCSSVTSGFFRGWAFMNAPKILKNYPKDYYEKFMEKVDKGLVKPYVSGYEKSEI